MPDLFTGDDFKFNRVGFAVILKITTVKIIYVGSFW